MVSAICIWLQNYTNDSQAPRKRTKARKGRRAAQAVNKSAGTGKSETSETEQEMDPTKDTTTFRFLDLCAELRNLIVSAHSVP